MNFLSADSSLSFPLPLPARAKPARAFRFPRQMHVPQKAIAIDFHVDPNPRWIVRSFVFWLRPTATRVPAWLR